MGLQKTIKKTININGQKFTLKVSMSTYLGNFNGYNITAIMMGDSGKTYPVTELGRKINALITSREAFEMAKKNLISIVGAVT